MGKASKKDEPEICHIKNCSSEAARSISSKKIGDVFDSDRLDFSGRRTKLCKTHYREYKKATKKDRKLDSLGWEL